MKNRYFFGSLLLAGTAVFSASAQETVTVNIADYGDGKLTVVGTVNEENGNVNPIEAMEYEGISFTFAKTEESKTDPALYNNSKDIRLYADNTMTITAPEGKTLKEITFNMIENWYQYGPVTADNGTVVCNGGDTDVTMADKVNAKPYVWTAENENGVPTVTLTVSHDTFDGSKRCQFRFTSAVAELAEDAPVEVALDEYLNIEECYPTPSSEGVIDTEEFPGGMAFISLPVALNIQKNMDCKEPVLLYHDDEPMSQIFTDTNEDMSTPPFVSVDQFSFGMDDDDNPYRTSIINVVVGEDPIVSPGYYYLEIPDGFFTWQGKEVLGMGLFYEIPGDGSIENAGPLSSYIEYTMPEINMPLNVEEEYSGIAMLMYGINAEGLPVDINRECEEDILLMTAKGEILSRIKASTDPFSDDYDYTVFTPYAMLDPFSIGTEGVTSVMIVPFEEGYTTPGKYTLSIPDNFFIATGEDSEIYGFEGCNFGYQLVEGTVLGTFNSLVFDAYPLPNENVDVATDEWNTWGLDSYMFLIDGYKNFELNLECTEPVVIKRGETVLYEIPSTNTFTDGGKYTEVWHFRAFSDENDDDFGVNPEAVAYPMTVAIYAYDEETDMGEFEVGTYTLSIPDGYFKAGDFTVDGATYTYYVVNNLTAVDTFKAEDSVTVFTINGVRVLDNAPVDALRNLEKGFYIVNGKKVIMK